MTSFYDSLKFGFASDYLQRYHAALVADTRAVAEFASRDFAKAAMWVPGRLVDQVNLMLAKYRENDNSGTAQAQPKLPIMLVGIARDYSPAPAERSVRVASEPLPVTVPGDRLSRELRIRTVHRQHRAQVVIIAPDVGSADSLVLQLHAFAMALQNRRFYAPYKIAGVMTQWPVLIEDPDVVAPIGDTEDQTNLTVLAVDMTLWATVPLVTGPGAGEPNDGQGKGTLEDPHGYPPLKGVTIVDAAREDLAPSPSDTTVFVKPS